MAADRTSRHNRVRVCFWGTGQVLSELRWRVGADRSNEIALARLSLVSCISLRGAQATRQRIEAKRHLAPHSTRSARLATRQPLACRQGRKRASDCCVAFYLSRIRGANRFPGQEVPGRRRALPGAKSSILGHVSATGESRYPREGVGASRAGRLALDEAGRSCRTRMSHPGETAVEVGVKGFGLPEREG